MTSLRVAFLVLVSWPVLCAALSGTAAAQEKVLVRRYSDVVAVREGPSSAERVLYAFNPTANLIQGGQVEQGSSGQSEVVFSGGGRIVLYGAARLELETIDAGGDVVRLPMVVMVEAHGGARPLTLTLPGELRCELDQASCEVHLEDGRLRVRNIGGRAIRVHGYLSLDREGSGREPVDSLELVRGEEVDLPLFVDPSDGPRERQDSWRGMVVSTEEDVDLVAAGDELLVGGDGQLRVGGVRTRVSDGAGLVLLDLRRRPDWLPPAPINSTRLGAPKPAPATPVRPADGEAVSQPAGKQPVPEKPAPADPESPDPAPVDPEPQDEPLGDEPGSDDPAPAEPEPAGDPDPESGEGEDPQDDEDADPSPDGDADDDPDGTVASIDGSRRTRDGCTAAAATGVVASRRSEDRSEDCS